MGYETEIFLVQHSAPFAGWNSIDDHWASSHIETMRENLPKGAKIGDTGPTIATVKLSKINGTPLGDFFDENRAKAKKQKRYLIQKWYPTEDHQDEWPELTDPYGDPYVLHDAQDTLDALRTSIKQQIDDGESVYRRFAMLEPLLETFIETFPDAAVVTRGY